MVVLRFARHVRRDWCRATLVSGLVSLALALAGSGGAVSAAPQFGAGIPVLHTVPLGYSPTSLVDDGTIGHALVFNTHDPSAEVIDVRQGTVLARMALGSAEDYDFAGVDPRSHHFFLSLPRGYYSKGGGNQVYMLDSRTGALVRALPGVEVPGELVVDAAHFHLFVADTHRNAVLMYDTRDGVLLRRLPSCHAPRELALSTRTDHLFVHCTDGTLVMYGATSGAVLHEVRAHLSTKTNNFDIESGVDTVMVVNDHTHRLIVSDYTMSTSALYDTGTGRLVGVLPLHGWFADDEAHGSFYFVGLPQHHLLGVPLEHQKARPGQFYILNGRTGSVLHMYGVPGVNPQPIGENPLTGHLLVLVAASSNLPGTLFVLDARSGRVLRAIAVGAEPYSAWLDPHSGLLLVLNAGWSKPGTLTILDLRLL